MTYAGQIIVERSRMQATIARLELALERAEADNSALRERVAEQQRRLDLAKSDSPGYHHQVATGVVGCPLCCETGCQCDTRR